MTKEHFLEIKITLPGRITAQYLPVIIDALRLEKILQPLEHLPFDLGILPTALTEFNEPFGVLVLGSLSHPAHTEMESLLLDAVQRAGEAPLLLVAPTADDGAPPSLDRIPPDQRAAILNSLQHAQPGQWYWLDMAQIEPHLHKAALRYRSRKMQDKLPILDPAWQPLHFGRPPADFTGLERYTPAEYTFFELPHRFQQYVGDLLAPDERILYSARRPAMPRLRRGFFSRHEQLQEGVLILTSQRLIHLAELLPPDSANIRYGFHTTMGMLERLCAVSVSDPGTDLLFLRTKWDASGANTSIEWLMPSSRRASLEELTSLLQKFIATDPADCILRRAATPAPPDHLPSLRDPASSDTRHLPLLNERFSNALSASLRPGEIAHAWALLPEWFDKKLCARVLVATSHQLLLLSDRPRGIPLNRVATLEFTSSILASSLVINHLDGRGWKRTVIPFPYPVQNSFRNCFEAARRCMAVLPCGVSPTLKRAPVPPQKERQVIVP